MAKGKTKKEEPHSPVRGPGGSSFATCPKCNKQIAAALLNSHGCGILPDPPKAKKDDSSDDDQDSPVEKKVVKTKAAEKEKKVPKKRAPRKKKDDDDDEKPKKKRKTKKEKDENHVKKALSAYMFYSQVNRPSFKEKNPDAKPKDLMRIIAEAWKGLDEPAKKEYNEMAAKDKERHAAEVAAKGLPEKKSKTAKAKSKKKKEEESEDDDDKQDDKDDAKDAEDGSEEEED